MRLITFTDYSVSVVLAGGMQLQLLTNKRLRD